MSKMPERAETHFRTAWKDLHGFNRSGGWQADEDVTTKLFRGFMSTPQFLFVPDVANIGRRSFLSQKPMKGTLITDSGIENMDFTLKP